MEMSVTQENGRALFEIKGNIDETGAEELKARFHQLETGNLSEVVFDFKDVIHIGSAGIGKLLLFYKDLALNGGVIRIVNASETIRELFYVLKLDTIFVIDRSPISG